MSIRKFAFPTSIVFGDGASRQVASHLVEAGYVRPLVVTDGGLAALPVFARFLGGLTAAGRDVLTILELSEQLLIRHHTAGELVTRLANEYHGVFLAAAMILRRRGYSHKSFTKHRAHSGCNALQT